MYQQLYCFGGGDTGGGGGSAGDFDDSYNQAMGYTDSSGQATGSGGDSDPARTESGAVARTSNYESQIEAAARAAAGGGDYTDVFAGDTAAFNDMQRALSGAATAPSTAALGPSMGDTTTPVQAAPRDVGQISRAEQLGGARQYNVAPAAAGAITRDEQLARQGRQATETELGEIDVFDTAYTGGAVPAAGPAADIIGEARRTAPLDAPADTSTRRTIEEQALTGSFAVPSAPRPDVVTDFDGVTLSMGPGVPKDEFVQDTTPRTKEEQAMAEDRGYFNYQDLNKDGTVTDFERVASAQAFGLVGYLSDLGRRMNVGPTNADGTAAIPGRDYEPERTASGALVDQPIGFDYEGQAYGTPDSIYSQDGGDGGGPAPVVAPIAPVTCPEGYKYNSDNNSCEYVGVVLGGSGATQLAPITQTTQYTGIAGLEPFVLQPSYTAPTSFAPLYNVG